MNPKMAFATRHKHIIALMGYPGTHNICHSTHVHPIDLGITPRLRTVDPRIVTCTPPYARLSSSSRRLDENFSSYMRQNGVNVEISLLDATEAKPT